MQGDIDPFSHALGAIQASQKDLNDKLSEIKSTVDHVQTTVQDLRLASTKRDVLITTGAAIIAWLVSVLTGKTGGGH